MCPLFWPSCLRLALPLAPFALLWMSLPFVCLPPSPPPNPLLVGCSIVLSLSLTHSLFRFLLVLSLGKWPSGICYACEMENGAIKCLSSHTLFFALAFRFSCGFRSGWAFFWTPASSYVCRSLEVSLMCHLILDLIHKFTCSRREEEKNSLFYLHSLSHREDKSSVKFTLWHFVHCPKQLVSLRCQ